MTFAEVMEHVAQAFEALGVLVLAAGTLWSFLLAGLSWRRSGQAGQAYAVLRRALGGTLLLGVEVLVAPWPDDWDRCASSGFGKRAGSQTL
jgi:uncharacterized membrane protein